MRKLILSIAAAVFLVAAPNSTSATQTPHCTKGVPCGHSCIAASKTCHTATSSAAPAPTKRDTAAKAAAADASAPFVGSSAGHTYYINGCSGAKKLAAANLVYFKSAADAEKAGYTPSKAKGCS